MAASWLDISNWFDEGVSKGATHMIVVCDTWDYEDYPVFVKPGQDARAETIRCRSQRMQRVMEVYNLSMDKDSQMNEANAFHY
jgi:hypothetical protein